MDHRSITENEITHSPFFPVIHDGEVPKTIFEALFYDGKILPLNTKPVAFRVSTSNWDTVHLKVLNVVCLGDLPLSRIFPQAHMIPETSELAVRVQGLFGLAKDEVKRGSFDETDITRPFYSELSFLLGTFHQTPSPPPPRIHRPRPGAMSAPPRSVVGVPDTILSGSFPDSSSGSTFSYDSPPDTTARESLDEQLTDSSEVVTNNMIVAFASILSYLAYPVKNPLQDRPMFNAKPDSFTLLLQGAEIKSINDGSGWKMRFSKGGNQWVRKGGAPLISLEVCSPHNI
jgi:hypothetical protein